MRLRKTIFDDGFQSYLTEGAIFIGGPGIPMMMDLGNVQIPKDMIPLIGLGPVLTSVSTCTSICMIGNSQGY